MVEYDRRGQAIPQFPGRYDLIGTHADLYTQPSAFTRFDKGSIISIDVGALRGSASEKRMPRTPPSASIFSSASVTVGRMTATPRALGPSRAIASSVTRLSVS